MFLRKVNSTQFFDGSGSVIKVLMLEGRWVDGPISQSLDVFGVRDRRSDNERNRKKISGKSFVSLCNGIVSKAYSRVHDRWVG